MGHGQPVLRALARLVASGLVSSRMVGRQRHYLANADNKRNVAEYSGDAEVEVRLPAALQRVAQALERRVREQPLPA